METKVHKITLGELTYKPLEPPEIKFAYVLFIMIQQLRSDSYFGHVLEGLYPLTKKIFYIIFNKLWIRCVD